MAAVEEPAGVPERFNFLLEVDEVVGDGVAVDGLMVGDDLMVGDGLMVDDDLDADELAASANASDGR